MVVPNQLTRKPLGSYIWPTAMSFASRPSTDKLIRPIMPELDSLRGIAILLVLFFHGFNYPGLEWSRFSGLARMFITASLGGWTGVYLFFVLSGFLITGILLDSKPKPHYYRRFYIHRALRILPAFYLLLVLLIVLPRTGWLENRRVGWPFIGLSFLYLANLTPLFGVPAQYAALWSLAVEEHFYLLWPAVVRALSRGAAAWCALGIFLASPMIRVLVHALGYNAGTAYTWLVADGLAIGALMGVLSRGPLAERRPMFYFSAICTAAAIGLFTFGTPFGIWRGSTFFGAALRPTAVNLFCAGVLSMTLLIGASRFGWFVRRPLLQWFGGISYGLYLVHMLAFDFTDHWLVRFFPGVYLQLPSRLGFLFLRFFFSAGLAVGVAFLSRKYFEQWFLNLKDRWTPPTSREPSEPMATAEGRTLEQRTA
jgi:peptidoglycan/LPS O-acetylase OafA/YrhL